MSKYKGEGYSNTFNYGIKTFLRRKQCKDKLLALVTINKDIRAMVLFQNDSLISSRCYVLPHDPGAKKRMEAISLREYNLFKMYLMKGILNTLDSAELI